MTRTEYEMDNIRCKKASTAIKRFLKKYPECVEWEETLVWMAENNEELYCDKNMADGSKNEKWSYALHFDQNEDSFYICVIERNFDDEIEVLAETETREMVETDDQIIFRAKPAEEAQPAQRTFTDTETDQIITLEELQRIYETEIDHSEYETFGIYLKCCMWWNGGTLKERR